MATDSPEPNGGEQESAWNYLAYQVLSRLDEEQHDWRSVTSGQFSKLPCIADHYLIDRLNRDIDFPRYWYKYGEVGNREPLDSTLFIIEEAEWGGLEVRPAKADIEFEHVDGELRADIDEAVKFVVDNFANVKIDRVKELQYEHFAPNDFVRTFDNLRDLIYRLSEELESNETLEEEGQKSRLNTLLKGAVSTYREDTYEKMKPDFVEWATVIRLLINHGEIGKAEAQLEEFWDVFSKVHLRMEHNNHPFHNQNRRWKQENEDLLSKYRNSFNVFRETIVNSQEFWSDGEFEEAQNSIRNLME